MKGVHRRRSRGWWGVFLCACLAMGVYIAFDILDLDGSELRDPLPGDAMAAEPVGGEAERLLAQNLSTPEVSYPAFLALVLPSVSESPRATSRTTLSTTALRLDRIFPRVFLRRETAATTSTADDPA